VAINVTNPIRPNRFRRLLERLLLLAGIAGIGSWLGFNTIMLLGQDWSNWSFQRQSRGEAISVAGYLRHQQERLTGIMRSWAGLAPSPQMPLPQLDRPVTPGRLANNDLIGRIAIPRLHLITTVREGTGQRTLAIASGHIRGTSLPGQNGNVGVAGHRDTFFRGLAGIRADDLIEFETFDARFVYQVSSTSVVKPDAVSVLKPGLFPELTLVTCYPFDTLGSAPDRFIVKARLISQTPRRQNLAVAQQEAPVKHIPAALRPSPEPPGSIAFQIGKSRSRQLAPGISLGVTEIDPLAREVDGWLWVMPDRRTIWLRNHPAQEPLVFYQDGERRELMIAGVTSGAASGYLLMRQQHAR